MTGLTLVTRGYIHPLPPPHICPILPEEASNLIPRPLLVKALDCSANTEALGIHQSDIIIRSALIAAIADIRAKPWLLDYVFASLPRDQLTRRDYGENEVSEAKKWFLKTDFPVFMSYRVDEAKLPCISIGLQDSTEAESTTGDVHWQSTEDNDADWPIIAGPFDPTNYNASTGVMGVPNAIGDGLILAPDMVLIDRVGHQFVVTNILDKYTLVIAPGTIADFAGSVLKGKRPSYLTELESLSFKETYQIGCHVQGEPFYLTYLHSIVVFILLRYKEVLIEARGFERSTIASTQFSRNEAFENELAFSRYINITGFVRHYWPKAIDPKITGLATNVAGAAPFFFSEINNKGTGTPQDGDQPDPLWLAEQDGIGFDPSKK